MLSLTLLQGGYLHASTDSCQSTELKKVVVKEFSVNKNSSLDVINKYGKIETKIWDKQSVKIEGTVIVKGRSKSSAQEQLDKITVEISQSGNVISAITNIESKASGWFSGWGNSFNNTDMEINYMISMPSDLDINFENKYGNIYLQDLKSKVNINLKYGNMEANNIDNNLKVALAYSKATAGTVKDLNVQLAYSDYRGVKAENVVVNSKYSKFYLDYASELNSNSKYDSYKLGTISVLSNQGAYDDFKVRSVNSADIKTKYSGVEILSLGSDLNMEISYGSVRIENMKTTCKSVEINTRYAPVKIYGVVPARVEIEGKYFDAKLGSDFIEKSRVSESSYKHIKGFKISEKGSAVIKIVSSYGDVYMN